MSEACMDRIRTMFFVEHSFRAIVNGVHDGSIPYFPGKIPTQILSQYITSYTNYIQGESTMFKPARVGHVNVPVYLPADRSCEKYQHVVRLFSAV